MTAEREPDPHLVAIGAYLRARRVARGLTQTQAGAASGISTANLQRIEGGGIDTAGTGLLRLMDAVAGDFDDLIAILRDPEPTPEKARQLAETPRAAVPSERLAALVAEIERDAGRDPELLAALAGFLAGRRSRPW